MSTQLYTADEVAGLLNLHVKTIRRYVRDGRLKARRIGKEYRIARADLDDFAGETRALVVRTRHVIASSIVDIDAISPDESHRITTMIMASLNPRKGEADFPRVAVLTWVLGLVRRSAIEGSSTAVDRHGVEKPRKGETGEKRAQRHATCNKERSGQVHQHGRGITARGRCKIRRGSPRR